MRMPACWAGMMWGVLSKKKRCGTSLTWQHAGAQNSACVRAPWPEAVSKAARTIVPQHAHGLRERPARVGVGAEAPVVDRKGGRVGRVLEVLVKLAHHHRAQHALRGTHERASFVCWLPAPPAQLARRMPCQGRRQPTRCHPGALHASASEALSLRSSDAVLQRTGKAQHPQPADRRELCA